MSLRIPAGTSTEGNYMSNLFHVIKDPVHGTMQFTSLENAWVKPFIDSPNFQRLRHIKQLGLGDFIFPGAVHSRFNHSLGCCYVASQIAHKVGLADEERQLVMIACLLHDIGHGPFSHAFEGIFEDKGIRHEAWTPYFLEDYGTKSFFSTYNALNLRHHLTEEKFSAIDHMIMHRPAAKSVLADIVSSQLDADRLDYLLRDSHFCGVKYGEFDFRWMLHCMAIVPSDEGERLGITHKGIGAVEHYLMARRLMMRNIYHLPKKLALEMLLVRLLASLAHSVENHKPFAALCETRMGQFLIAVNRFNLQPVTVAAKNNFLKENYVNYKELCDYDVFSLIKQLIELDSNHSAAKIAARLQYRRMPHTVLFDHRDLPKAEAELAKFMHRYQGEFEDWQLMLIETPHQFYSGEDDPILMMNEQGTIDSISHFSVMINAISDKLEHVAFLCIDHEIAADSRVVELARLIKTIPGASYQADKVS